VRNSLPLFVGQAGMKLEKHCQWNLEVFSVDVSVWWHIVYFIVRLSIKPGVIVSNMIKSKF